MSLIFHIARGSAALSRTYGGRVVSQSSRVLVTTKQTQPFTTSVICRKREYGPQAAEDKVEEVKHWVNVRYVAVGLIPIIPVALAYPNIYTDMLLSATLVLHCHWSFSGVCHDYIHGQTLPVIMKYVVLALSAGALGGLAYFNYYDVGFGRAVNMLYTQL